MNRSNIFIESLNFLLQFYLFRLTEERGRLDPRSGFLLTNCVLVLIQHYHDLRETSRGVQFHQHSSSGLNQRSSWTGYDEPDDQSSVRAEPLAARLQLLQS